MDIIVLKSGATDKNLSLQNTKKKLVTDITTPDTKYVHMDSTRYMFTRASFFKMNFLDDMERKSVYQIASMFRFNTFLIQTRLYTRLYQCSPAKSAACVLGNDDVD